MWRDHGSLSNASRHGSYALHDGWFVWSINKHLVATCRVPDTTLGTRDTAVNTTGHIRAHMELRF